jgi:NAD(P)-dependent dehydrogenase (short-subunit alcohol dehydrogenase family)
MRTIMTSKREDRKGRPRALVTGGAIRLGRAIALGLAAAGMDVAIGYHRSAAEARATTRALEAAGARAVAVRADLADPRAARRLVTTAARALGGLDILVNSAARFGRTPLASVTPAQYDALLDVNLRAALFCAQAAAEAMPRGGHIVNLGDVMVDLARPGWAPYTLSKAGIVAMTRGLARELRPQRIAVNCVAPGAVLKPEALSPTRWRRITRGHAGRPEDVVAAVLFFATCPRYITGQVLRVDGSETA